MGGILLLLSAALVTSLAILELPDTSKWLNIDCGASLQWSIENNLLIWQTDDKYVDSGTKIVVTESKTPAMPMNTLRYFPQGSKNCYNLPVLGKNKVLLRAGFYYGDYDNISKPPMFDLQFDGNQWATVNASLDEEPIYHEVFYVPQGSSISVCLLRRAGGGIPFISSLELEPFPEDMYKEVAGDVGFYLKERINFGESVDIRFNIVDEKYNRIWKAKEMQIYPNMTWPIITDTSNANRIPLTVIDAAVAATDASQSLELLIDLSQGKKQAAYIILYFMELNILSNFINGRKFAVYINDQIMEACMPINNSTCQVLSFYPVEVSGPITVKLTPIEGTLLPPMINAMEVFTAINLNQVSGGGGANGSGGGNGIGGASYSIICNPSLIVILFSLLYSVTFSI